MWNGMVNPIPLILKHHINGAKYVFSPTNNHGFWGVFDMNRGKRKKGK
jgi:hypothetical protein